MTLNFFGKNFSKTLTVLFTSLAMIFILQRNVCALTSGPLQPEVATFSTVGKSGQYVDKATGDFIWFTPIVDIPGRGGLNLSLSLKYSGGIKTNQEASWVGLGWNLSPGVIYRTTGHVPEDYKGGSAWTVKRGSGSSINIGAFGLGYSSSHSGGKSSSGWSISSGVINSITNFMSFFSIFGGYSKWNIHFDKTWSVYGYGHFENPSSKGGWDYNCATECFRREYHNQALAFSNGAYAPSPPMDDYIVSGPGPSGELIPWRPNFQLKGYYVDNQYNNTNNIAGSIKFYFADHKGTDPDWTPLTNTENHSAVRVEHEMSATTGRIETFKITDTNGKTYVYGQPALINSSGYHSQYDGDNYSKFGLNAPYAYAWYLTEILSSDYVDSDGTPGPSDGDRGNWIDLNYCQHEADYSYSMPYEGWMEAAFIHENDKYTRSWGSKELWYLCEVNTPTHQALFDLSTNRLDGREANATSSSLGTSTGGTDHPAYLDKISLYTRTSQGTTPVEDIHFNYDYSLRPSAVNSNAAGGGSLTLTSISRINSSPNTETHTFAYNGPNPTWGKYKWDKWGFYKNNGSWGNHSAVNAADVTAWSLTDVSYPTGGTLHIDYESDTYFYGSTQQNGGGLRVSELTLDDGLGNTSTRKFEYAEGTVGNGIPFPYGSTAPENQYRMHPFSAGEVHYGKTTDIPVFNSTEVYGKIETEFTTAEDYHAYANSGLNPPPYNGGWVNAWGNIVNGVSVWYIPYVSGRGRVTSVYNRDYAWKVPKSVKIYNSSGQLLKHEQYELTEDLPRQSFSFLNRLGIVNGSDYYIDYYLWGKLDVTKKTIYQDGVFKEFEYQYNSWNNQVTMTTQSDSTGKKIYKHTGYCEPNNNCGLAYDEKVGGLLEARNILTLPFSSWTKEDDPDNQEVLAYNYITYLLLEDGETDHSRMRLYKKAQLEWEDLDGDNLVDWSTTPGGADSYWGISNESFDQYGNVTSQKDLLGTYTAFVYEPDRAYSVLKSLTKGNQTTSYTYGDTKFHKPTKIDFPDGTSVNYGYDGSGRLATKYNSSGLNESYQYHFAGNSITTSDLNWVRTEKQDVGQTRVSKTYYDGLGREVMKSSLTPDGQWLLKQKMYDELDRPYINQETYKSAGEEYGQNSPYGYSLETYYADPLGRVKDFYANYLLTPEHKVSKTYANSGTDKFLTIETDPSGIETKTYKSVFETFNSTERLGITNNTYKDYMGNPYQSVDAEGKATSFLYDTYGRKIATKRPDMKSFISVSYPWLGHVTEEWKLNKNGDKTIFRDSNLYYSKDASQNAEPKHIVFYYDNMGRETAREIRADDTNAYSSGSWIGTHYDEYPTSWPGYPSYLNQPVRSDLTDWQDRAKEKITCVSGLGQMEIYFYDSAGRLGEKHVIIDSQDYMFEYNYNVFGELTNQTIDPVNGIKATYEYNTLGQISTVSLAKGSQNVQVANITYNPDGKIDTLTRGNGVITNYDYDSLKRTNLIQTSGLESSSGFDRYFAYDMLGRVLSIHKGLDENAPKIGDFTGYDGFGRLKASNVKSSFGSKSRDLEYTYDNVGNRLSKTEGYWTRRCRPINAQEEALKSILNPGDDNLSQDMSSSDYSTSYDLIDSTKSADAISSSLETKALSEESFNLDAEPGSSAVSTYIPMHCWNVYVSNEDDYEYYSNTNRLKQITYANGDVKSFIYDNNGNITWRGEGEIIDADSQTIMAIHDGDLDINNVVRDTDATMTVGDNGIPMRKIFFKFDLSGSNLSGIHSALLRLNGAGSSGEDVWPFLTLYKLNDAE